MEHSVDELGMALAIAKLLIPIKARAHPWIGKVWMIDERCPLKERKN